MVAGLEHLSNRWLFFSSWSRMPLSVLFKNQMQRQLSTCVYMQDFIIASVDLTSVYYRLSRNTLPMKPRLFVTVKYPVYTLLNSYPETLLLLL